jgi:hypothetical protein
MYLARGGEGRDLPIRLLQQVGVGCVILNKLPEGIGMKRVEEKKGGGE